MTAVDSLIKARWIVPVEPHGVVFEHYAVATVGGRIVDLLPAAEADARYTAAETIELLEHALIPGLVNAHTHAAMTLLRGVADDLPLMEWLQAHIWPLEARWVGESFVRDGTELAIAEMLRGGTTCFNDMYFFPEVTAQTALHAGIRAVVGMIVVDFPTAWAADADQYLTKGLALRDELRHQTLVRTAFAPHAPYSVSDPPLARVRTLAQELDQSIHMHLHETETEIQQGHDSHGMRPLQRLRQLDLLGPNLVAVHMTHLLAEEIEELAKTGVHVVHCPESNLKLASGFCPVAALLQAGVNVALGTDGAASNNDLDLFGEMRTAALLAKAIARDAGSLPAATALRMATLNGAKALGLDDEIGSLAVGKSADLVAVDLGTLETLPLYDPVSDIVYAAGRHQVSDVWVAGRRLLARRELMTLDAAEIRAKAQGWRQRLAGPPSHPGVH
ncbi:MAG: TRZ/ATZ family hydrolase [Methylococcaceae bacterium]|nr:TRZ/ATZ family hydrolase [Methylococcaceae bacterium]